MRGKRIYSEAEVDKLLSLAYHYNHMRDTWLKVKDCNIYTKKHQKWIKVLMDNDRKAFESYLANPTKED